MTQHRRRYARTPEGRAEALSQQGYMASGNSYIAVEMRGENHYGKVPFIKDPEKCDHGFGMCPSWECVESWTMDYRVLLHRTNAGRELARLINVDPEKVAAIERSEDSLRVLTIEEVRPEPTPAP